MSQNEATIDRIVREIKHELYTEPSSVSDAEAYGVMTAHYFEWDGARIVEAFLSTLEDANYHTFRARVQELWGEEAAKWTTAVAP